MSAGRHDHGLIIITFDEGTTDTACCGETSGVPPSHPNSAEPLRTIEDIFGLSHLGDAAMPQVKPFGPDVFSNY